MHQKLSNEILFHILHDEFPLGSKFSSRSVLIRDVNTSQNTLQKALTQLIVQKMLIKTHHGIYVSSDEQLLNGNVKKCAVGKHPKSEKHGNTAQFSEVERSGTQEKCGGIGSGCRLRLRPLPVLHRRQSQWVARIDPNAVVVDKNIAENDCFDLFSR